MERLKSTVKERSGAYIERYIFTVNFEISINLGVSSGRSFPLKELELWGDNLTGLESSGETRSRRRLFAAGRWGGGVVGGVLPSAVMHVMSRLAISKTLLTIQFNTALQ